MADWKGRNWFDKTGYSLAGIRDGLLTEKAIREEAAVLVFAVSVAFWRFGLAGWTNILRVFLICLAPLAVEFINTAFELMVDMGFGTDYNEKIRMAKDMLSAAVLCTLTISYGFCILIIFF